MIIYNLRKPVDTGAFSSVGVTGENNSFTARFLIRELADNRLSFRIHLRFADGSVNTVVPDEVSVDDKGTTIVWNVKKNDIFVHGFFEMQIEGRNSDGYIFQTEIVRMFADESIPVEDKEYENPNAETLKLREEAYNFLCELKLQQDKLDENMKLLLATDITKKQDEEFRVSDIRDVTDEEKNYPSIKYLNGYFYDINETYSMDEIDEKLGNKADNSAVISGCEGVLSFALYSDFVQAGTKSTDGSLNTDVKYRVTSEDIMQFDYDLNVTVDEGFTGYVVKYVDGSYESVYSLGNAKYNYVIPAGTEFRLHIRRAVEDTNETANIREFVNAVKFQTKIAAEVAQKADKAEVDSALAAKADKTVVDSSLATKADNTTVVSISEGLTTFALYSDFVQGQTNSSDGELNRNIKYRVISEDIMKFDYDLNVTVDDGFTGYVVKYVDGSYESVYSLGNAKYNYVIPAGTEFRLHIRRAVEDTTETANIREFVNAVKFQTKIAAEVAQKSDKTDVDSALAAKADNNTVVSIGEGLTTFTMYSNFVLGQIGTSGAYNPNIKYRVISEDIMKFDYDLNVTVDEGFTGYVVEYNEDGSCKNSPPTKSLANYNNTIPAGTEFRLHIRRTVEDTTETANISEFVNAVKFQTKTAADITEIDGRVKVIEEKINTESEDDSIPDYYYADNYLPDKINEIKQACRILHGVTFAFISDVHFKVNQKQSKKLLRKILNETNVPFVIFGGDTVYLYGTEDELHEQIAEFNNFKSYIGKDKLFCTRGNHDLYNVTSATDKTMHPLTTADVYDALFRDSEHSVSSMSVNNGCYCIDNEPQKTRIIMLNTSDFADSPDNLGGGIMFRGTTLEWLSKALTEKENYKIIIACHHHINNDFADISGESIGYDFNGESPEALLEMVTAFKNKGTFSATQFGVTVNADFANTTNELVCVVSGHRHMDLDSNQNGILNIVTTCDCIDVKDGYGRQAGTISEQAFDIYCIDYDTNTIKTVRIGAGENREFTY